MPSRCAVFGCDNQNDQKDRWLVMPHVQTLAFHSCSQSVHYKKWNALINRQDRAWKGVNKSTKVCSNHFKLGRPFPDSPHPTMYMKGYSVDDNTACNKRPPPRERIQAPSRKRVKTTSDHTYTHNGSNQEIPEDQQGTSNMLSSDDGPHTSDYSVRDLLAEHDYDKKTYDICDNCSGFVQELITCNMNMSQRIRDLELEVRALKSEQRTKQPDTVKAAETVLETRPRVTIEDLKESPDLVYMHTGVMNYETFSWILEEISFGAENLHYYRGAESQTVKNYQEKNTRKPGPERKLRQEDELLMTLMRLKLDLLEEYLAFQFRVSESTVSQILSTWIPLLSRELSGLIYWPTQEEIHNAYPECFKKYDTVRAIIDCTEVAFQKPSLASANSQIFSAYKNKPTVKFLLACTPNGTVSFVSKAAGGRMSDKKITKDSGLASLFEPGDICMADRGFTIQDLLLPYGARLVMPPFTVKGKQFTVRKAAQTKTIANARIHIERVINRWKDFRILQGTVPLSMKDTIGDVARICGALVNLLPSVVPLSKTN